MPDDNITDGSVQGRNDTADPRRRTDQKARLREILGILGKYNVVRGLTPEKLRLILTDLGPTYIKLGQIMSNRFDMLPKEYCDELAKLCQDVAPMPFDEVAEVIENSLGRGYDEIFASFERTPVGSASIAQVHAATLPDGSRVVVKVQREGIYEKMEQDIALLRHAAGLLKLGTGDVIDLNMVLNEMWAVSQEEMDFLQEAENCERFYELNSGVRFVTCPKVYREYTTRHVFVMEYIDGYNMDDFDGLKGAGYDLDEIGRKLADNYIRQITQDGFFHADPHMGNLKVRGGCIVYIDMGMMGRLSARDQGLLTRGIKAVAKRDIADIAAVILAMGKCERKIDHMQLHADIDDMLTRYGGASLGGMDVAVMINDVMELAKAHGIAMPEGVTMLARGLGTLEGVIARLSPSVDVISVVAAHVSGSIFSDIDVKKEAEKTAATLLESGGKALDIPALAADALTLANKGQGRINVLSGNTDAEHSFAERIVFRISAALIACALIISGGLMAVGSNGLTAPSYAAFGIAVMISAALTWTRFHKPHKK